MISSKGTKAKIKKLDNARLEKKFTNLFYGFALRDPYFWHHKVRINILLFEV